MAWYNPLSWGEREAEEYVADRRASRMDGAYGATGFLRGQMGVAAPGVGPATVDQAAANEARGELMGLAGRLSEAGQGRGPSGAAMAAQAQRDAALTNAAALQAGRRGTSAAAGARMAAMAASGGGQRAAQTEAIGRANEMAGANAQLGSVLGGVRGQDLAVAGQDAGLRQQIGLANQDAALRSRGLDLNAAGQLQGQAQAEMNARMQQEQMRFGNLDPGRASYLETLGPAAATAATAVAMSDERSKERTQPLRPGTMYSPGNAKEDIVPASYGMVRSAPVQLMGIGQRVMPRQADGGRKALGDILNTVASAYLAKQLESKAEERDLAAQRRRNLGKTDAEMAEVRRLGSPASEAERALARAGQEIRYPDGRVLRTEDLGDIGQLTGETPEQVLERLRSPGSSRFFVPGGGISDPAAKEDVREMMGELRPYEYSYKPRAQAFGAPPGRHVSVMADDLERSPLGAEMVGRDPASGYKTVDYLRGLPAMLAGIADLNGRLQRLEKGRK
jgi:hypothetical protein